MGAVATTAPRQGATRERQGLPWRQAVRMPERGRATLDDRITTLWSRLVETGTGDCPVCGAELSAGRECGGCGSELS